MKEELIDRKTLLRKKRYSFETVHGVFPKNEWFFKFQDVMNTPVVDAIKVVRCKDCESWNTWDKNGNQCSCAHFTLDDSRPAYTKPDDFCSYAEQR